MHYTLHCISAAATLWEVFLNDTVPILKTHSALQRSKPNSVTVYHTVQPLSRPYLQQITFNCCALYRQSFPDQRPPAVLCHYYPIQSNEQYQILVAVCLDFSPCFVGFLLCGCNDVSVCLSVCHTRDPRLDGSRYRNTFCTFRQSDVSSLVLSNFVILNLEVHPERVR